MKPVSLSKFRKQKARAEKQARANQNAVKFGRTKSEKTTDAAEQARAQRQLDDKKQDNSPE